MTSPENIQKDINLVFWGLCKETEPGRTIYSKFKDSLEKAKPENVIRAVDRLVKDDIPMDKLKIGISKALNLLHLRLSSLPAKDPVNGGLIDLVIRNNKILDDKLKKIRPAIKKINNQKDDFPEIHLIQIKERFKELREYTSLYDIMENIVFPILEKRWDDFRCVKVMWAIHDDIRKNLKNLDRAISEAIDKREMPSGNRINKILGDLYFDMYALKFRFEKILVPVILKTIGEDEINREFNFEDDLEFPLVKRIGNKHTKTKEMSELIDNSRKRKSLLKELILKLHEGQEPEKVRLELIETLDSIPYGEVVEVEQELIEEGLPQEEVLQLCDIHSAVLQGNVDLSASAEVPEGHPVDIFIKENKELKKVTGQVYNLLKALEEKPDAKLEDYLPLLIEKYNLLLDVDKHYQRKEYLVFPFLEKKGITGPPQVMWGKHDEIRDLLKGSLEILRTEGLDKEEFLASAELILTVALAGVDEMIIKEEEILFPMCMDHLTEADWFQVDTQTMEIGFCIYDPPKEWKPVGLEEVKTGGDTAKAGIKLPTGSFQVNELIKVLNALPVDMTFIDKNDKVKYFSQSADRIFTRSRAIINRDVRNCHPPSSVHIVEKILADFKAGKETYAPFWIQMKGKFIHIAYYALRDENGEYLGTLEVSQDLTNYRTLEGEQRILSYE